MTKMNPVGWFDIYVDDLARATKFYETVLGSKLEEMIDPTGASQLMSFPAEMSAYGACGALTKSPHAGPGAGGTVVYFMVSDCAEGQARVEAAGGTVIRPKFSIGEYGFVVLLQDTEGNIVGLNSMQ